MNSNRVVATGTAIGALATVILAVVAWLGLGGAGPPADPAIPTQNAESEGTVAVAMAPTVNSMASPSPELRPTESASTSSPSPTPVPTPPAVAVGDVIEGVLREDWGHVDYALHGTEGQLIVIEVVREGERVGVQLLDDFGNLVQETCHTSDTARVGPVTLKFTGVYTVRVGMDWCTGGESFRYRLVVHG